MAQYIDKDALVAEIERRKEESWLGSYTKEKGIIFDITNEILSFIDTLEIKENDFKDIKSVFEGQYLTKDKVVTTIEKLQDECEKRGDNNGIELLEKLFNKLDTIEVKEVDLEKIIDDYFKDWKFDDELDIMIKPNNYSASFTDLKEISKHFFEFGMAVGNKLQKGE